MIRKNWQLGIVCIILAVWVVFIIGKKQTVPPVLSDEELYKNTELDPADFQSVLPLDKEETCKMLNEFDRNSVDSIYVYINYGTGRGNSFVIDGETSLKRKNDIVKGLFSDAQSYSYADYEVGMDYSCYVILYDENHEKIMVVFCYSPNKVNVNGYFFERSWGIDFGAFRQAQEWHIERMKSGECVQRHTPIP